MELGVQLEAHSTELGALIQVGSTISFPTSTIRIISMPKVDSGWLPLFV